MFYWSNIRAELMTWKCKFICTNKIVVGDLTFQILINKEISIWTLSCLKDY